MIEPILDPKIIDQIESSVRDFIVAHKDLEENIELNVIMNLILNVCDRRGIHYHYIIINIMEMFRNIEKQNAHMIEFPLGKPN